MPQQPGRTAPPARRGTRTLAWALLALTLALLAATLAIGLTGQEHWAKVVGFIPIVITLALVGTLVAARTGNRLGWLFLAAADRSAGADLLDGRDQLSGRPARCGRVAPRPAPRRDSRGDAGR